MSSKKKIFITGATGFIGKHIVQKAILQGYEVYAFVRAYSDLTHLRGAHLLFGDITDKESIMTALLDLRVNNIGIDYVIHAAALTKSNDKKAFFKTNLVGTQNLIEVFRVLNMRPERIVFLSSLAACGPGKIGSTIQITDTNPVTFYGKSKLQAEPVIKDSNLPYVIIRPTAVYGPGEKDLFTVFKFINRSINPLLGNRPQELTFIYVDDLVKLVMDALSTEVINETYFATDGKIYTRKDLTLAISKALNKQPIDLIVPLPLVKGIAYITQTLNKLLGTPGQLNLDKYNELVAESWNCNLEPTLVNMGFESKHDLYSGINKTVQWYKQNKWI